MSAFEAGPSPGSFESAVIVSDARGGAIRLGAISAMDHVTKSVADLENDIENALEHLGDLDLRGKLPPELRPLLLLAPVEGSSVHVSLRHRDTVRQIRRAHGAQAFA